MSNTNGEINLIVIEIPVDDVDKDTLTSILDIDSDFIENEEYYRDDTLKLGYKNEAERVSSEIYDKHKNLGSSERIECMVEDLFNVPNFIGTSGSYGSYEYKITHTRRINIFFTSPHLLGGVGFSGSVTGDEQ